MWNISRTLKVSSSVVAKTIKLKLAVMRTATGKEDAELPLLQRISSLELTASEIAAQINASEFKSQTHQLFRGDCMKSGPQRQIDAKKPLLK
jgi:DNA-binding CsgD family transcriptional regulator